MNNLDQDNLWLDICSEAFLGTQAIDLNVLKEILKKYKILEDI